MRYDHPKAEMGANGIYGGVGSRPAQEAWTPGGQDQPAAKESIPKALRRLRLERSRSRRMESDGPTNWLGLFMLVFCVAFAGVVLLVSFGILDLPLL